MCVCGGGGQPGPLLSAKNTVPLAGFWTLDQHLKTSFLVFPYCQQGGRQMNMVVHFSPVLLGMFGEFDICVGLSFAVWSM